MRSENKNMSAGQMPLQPDTALPSEHPSIPDPVPCCYPGQWAAGCPCPTGEKPCRAPRVRYALTDRGAGSWTESWTGDGLPASQMWTLDRELD